MSFIWPAMLLLLLLDPGRGRAVPRPRAAAAGAGGGVRRLGRALRTACAPDPAGRRPIGAGRRRIPAVLWSPASTILVVALARPQSVIGVPRVEGTVILAFDVSGSMAATDLAPTRMEAAKAAARAFVERQPTARASSASSPSATAGFSVQAPTNDQAEVARRDRPARAPARHVARRRGSASRSTIDRPRETEPPTDYYSNRSPDADARADARPGRVARAGGHRPADRRREQRPTPTRSRPPRRPPTAACGSTPSGSAAPAGTTLEVDGFTRPHASSTRRCSSSIAADHRRHVLHRRRPGATCARLRRRSTRGSSSRPSRWR